MRDAYNRYSTDVMRQCKFIRPLLLRTPPDPTSFRPRDIREMIYLGKEFAKFGEQFIYDTMRFYSMSIAEFLDEYFESDLIKCHLSGSGIIGSAMGVYSPGTAYVLLHHYMGDVDGSIGAWGFARGGMGSVSKAIASAFKSLRRRDRHGCAGRARHRARRQGRRAWRPPTATNTARRSSSRISIRSAPSPSSSMRRISIRRSLKRARNFKIRGSSGKLNIALDGLPEFPALGKDNPLRFGDMHFLDSLEKMERAYDDWKNGTWSKEPYLDLLIPSMTRPDHGAAGQALHVGVRAVRAAARSTAATGPTRIATASRRPCST